VWCQYVRTLDIKDLFVSMVKYISMEQGRVEVVSLFVSVAWQRTRLEATQ